MKHPGKRDNKIRVLTAALCICHLINQFYTVFQIFVMKFISPQIVLVPQGASYLAWTLLDIISLHTFSFVHDETRSLPSFLVSRAVLPCNLHPSHGKHSETVESKKEEQKENKTIYWQGKAKQLKFHLTLKHMGLSP